MLVSYDTSPAIQIPVTDLFSYCFATVLGMVHSSL